MPPELGLLTTNMIVQVVTDLEHSSRPSQLWPKASPLYLGTYPPTREHPSQKPWGSHGCHEPGNGLTGGGPNCGPTVYAHPSGTLLSKVMEAVPPTQGPDRIHAHQPQTPIQTHQQSQNWLHPSMIVILKVIPSTQRTDRNIQKSQS